MNEVCELKKDINECDAVHNLKHYKLKGLDIESVDVIRAILTEEEFKGWCKGNALKYLLRAGKKDDEIQDLAKAVVYINWVTEGRSHS